MNPARSARRHIAGERSHQQEHRRARQCEAGKKEQVVGEQLRHASPDERRGDERGHDHRVREGQRPALGMEDVGVEQIERDPAAAGGRPTPAARSRRARRLRCARPCPQLTHLRIRHDGGQAHEERDHRKSPRPCTRRSCGGGRAGPRASRTRRTVLGQGAGGRAAVQTNAVNARRPEVMRRCSGGSRTKT